MLGIERLKDEMITQSLGAALLAAVGIPLCRIVFGGHLGKLTFASATVPAAIVFILVAACAYLGGRYGFLLLWMVVLTAWLTILVPMLADARWNPFTAMMLLPDGFLSWSMLALPLACATSFWARNQRTFRLFTSAAAATIWVTLAMANASLAQYAPDIGATPRQDPVLVWTVGAPTIVAPFLVCRWFIQRLRAHPRQAEGLSPGRP